MKIGLMWFDNTPSKPLAQKVQEAARFYESKYGKSPNMVWVHPSEVPQQAQAAPAGITVRGSRSILPWNYWIGEEA